jgi:nucleotide-binding universal stress UspA family protein
MTFERILVPIDFGPASSAALDCARDLARMAGATVYVVHVVDDVAARHNEFPAGALSDAQASIEQSARKRLNDLAEREEVRFSSTAILASTSPAKAIVRYAKDQAIDLIVMGTHGSAPVVRMFLGSVADRVLRTAACPVVMVRAAQGPTIGDDVPEEH